MGKIISKELSEKVLMLGVFYKKNAPGGMASLIAVYEKHFYKLKYISTWKRSNKLVKSYYAFSSICLYLWSLFFDRKIKIVHIHGAAYASFYRKRIFIYLAACFGKKVVYHMHAGEFEDFYSKSQRKKTIVETIRRVDAFVVLSQSWKDYFINIGIDSERIFVLNNIVEEPTAFQLPSRKVINVLFLGVLVETKGIYDLLDVIINNKDRFKDEFHFYIAGNEDSSQIVQLIKENDLSDLVTFLGWVKGESKKQLLYETDIFVLPSYFEGLPMSILEAMSYGAAIIATQVGGIPELVCTNENGILIEPGNKDSLEEAFFYMKDNRQKIKEFGDNNRQKIKDFYPDAVFSKLKKIYVDLLGGEE